MMRATHYGAMAMLLASIVGCSTMYYSTMEKFGFQKADILVDRVDDARDDQEQAKEQFKSALEQFEAVMNHDGGNLRKQYDKLAKELSRSEARANDVREQIDDVENVAGALFREWKAEIEQFSSDDLRQQSQSLYNDTQVRYNSLIGAMHRAESSMDPVLTAFQDQVLFLKHNLNAQAIASLEGTALELEGEIEALIREMEAAIAEADAFIASMGATG
ncbi:MAG: DUF2959 domain-containing protein [Planctomycetota bacterium]